jgi:hypothetical protein
MEIYIYRKDLLENEKTIPGGLRMDAEPAPNADGPVSNGSHPVAC